jgi:hypothetical protein
LGFLKSDGLQIFTAADPEEAQVAMTHLVMPHRRLKMVELVGIESYNAHNASTACNAGFVVRLLYGDSQSKQLRFHDKVRSQRPRGICH